MTLESRIVKLERQRAVEGSHPFDRLTPEQLADIAREFLLGLDVAELNSTDNPTRRATELLGIEPGGLTEWLCGYA